MTTIHLLNAAVMPHEGTYHLSLISPAVFKAEIQKAHNAGTLKHFIGYENTLELVEDMCSIDLGGTNVEQTEFTDKDTFYVIRLQRRVSPHAKRVQTHGPESKLSISDFDFFKGVYHD